MAADPLAQNHDLSEVPCALIDRQPRRRSS
jgi:hypothetical protein